MATYGNLWHLMATYGNFLYLITTYGNLWQLMATYDNFWQHMVTYGNLVPAYISDAVLLDGLTAGDDPSYDQRANGHCPLSGNFSDEIATYMCHCCDTHFQEVKHGLCVD